MRLFEQRMLGVNEEEDIMFIRSVLKELSEYTIEEIRVKIYERYNNSLKALGLTTDPFEDVTGISMQDAFVKRHSIMPNNYSRVFMADTAFIDSSMFPALIAYSESLDVNRPFDDIRKFDEGKVVFRCMFRPVVLCFPKYDFLPWTSRYIVTDWYQLGTEVVVTKGYIILEHEVLKVLSNSKHYDRIMALIAKLGNYFSHDLVAHGTISPLEHEAIELHMLTFLDPAGRSELETVIVKNMFGGPIGYIDELTFLPSSNYLKSTEVAALSLNLEISSRAFSMRPSLFKRLETDYTTLRHLLNDIAEDYKEAKEYVMTFYTYLLTRVISEADLRSGEFLQNNPAIKGELVKNLDFLVRQNPKDAWMMRQANKGGFPLVAGPTTDSEWSEIERVPHKEIYRKMLIDNPKLILEKLQKTG